MSEIKVKVTIQTDMVGSKCTDILEIDQSEWDEMTDRQKDEYCKESAFQMMEWGYDVIGKCDD